MTRKFLNRDGKRHLHETLKKEDKALRFKYSEVKPIATRPASVFLVESDLGEKRLLVCCPEMRIEQLVDILKVKRWRKKFTVTHISAGDLELQPEGGHHWYAPDGRKVNQSGEVML